MNRLEQKFTRWLIPKLETHFKAYSFEAAAPPATPDLHLVSPHGSIWIEAKVVREGEKKIKWQAGQIKWLRDHHKAGGESYMIYQLPDKRIFLVSSSQIHLWRNGDPFDTWEADFEFSMERIEALPLLLESRLIMQSGTKQRDKRA